MDAAAIPWLLLSLNILLFILLIAPYVRSRP